MPPIAAEAATFAARIAQIEERVAALTQTVGTGAEVDAGLLEASVGQAASEVVLAPTPESPARAIDIGALRVTLGGRDGARIDTVTDSVHDRGVAGSLAVAGPPAIATRSECAIAVWDAFVQGASLVRIAGAPGAGATALLRELAAEAQAHGYGRATLLTDVHGPARDIAQRMAVARGAEASRYHSATEIMQLFAGARELVLLDRAALTVEDAAAIGALFPTLHFVVVQNEPLAQTTTIALGGLSTDASLTLFEASYGRPIDRENRRVALDIGETVGLLPGPMRLIGAAARVLRRSFISLRVQCDSGDAIVRAFIANFSAADQRVLSALALARGPLAAHHLTYVAAAGDIRSSLERLVDAELIVVNVAQLYELPRYVEQRAPRVSEPENEMMVARLVDVFCDTLDPASGTAVGDSQVACAEAFVQAAFEQSQWHRVLAVGPRLAQACALRGAFGAWDRVLRCVESASAQIGDLPTRSLAQHDLGVRALLLGERDESATHLRAAVRERNNSGDVTGAAASRAVLALAEYRSPVSEPARQPAEQRLRSSAPEVAHAPEASRAPQAPHARTIRSRDRLGPVSLLLVGLGMVASLAFAVWFLNRPVSTFALTEFSSTAATIVAGSAAEVCVSATNAAVVEIFPDAQRLPGTGKHCVSVHPAVTTRYVAVASAVDGRQVREALTLDVRAAPIVRRLRIAAFSATPPRLEAGHTTRLCYAVTGANYLRIVPLSGDLTRLRSCRSITLKRAHRYEYKLLATGDNGQTDVRRVRVDVVAPKSRQRRSAGNALTARAIRQAIYQFDATPSIVQRGQTASLCVGVDRPARGYVSHVGRLASGVTRCYRVAPRTTTVYRLYVALAQATAVKTITVVVRPDARRRTVSSR